FAAANGGDAYTQYHGRDCEDLRGKICASRHVMGQKLPLTGADAHIEVKRRFGQDKSSISPPGFRTFQGRFWYRAVRREAYEHALQGGTLWRGIARISAKRGVRNNVVTIVLTPKGLLI